MDDNGFNYNTPLVCHVDHPDVGSEAHWVSPAGTEITGVAQVSSATTFTGTNDTLMEGIYHCTVTNQNKSYNIYVGIYNTDKGNYATIITWGVIEPLIYIWQV